MAKLKPSGAGDNISGNVQSKKSKRNYFRRMKRNVNFREYPNGAVVYVGHVPHGFFEDQMRKYFSQFGRVGRIQLCRSRKNGKSKGYAFVEFQLKEVAEIAAEAMNNYLLFQKLMKCHVIPKEKLHPNLFRNSGRRLPVLPHIRNLRMYQKPQTDDKLKKSALKTMWKKNRLVNKLMELGINYELPEEMFKRNKQNNIQSEEEEEAVSTKRQRISSPENQDSSPGQHIMQIMAKRKKKQKRSSSEVESGDSNGEQPVPVKKQKFITPRSKQTSVTHKQVTVKTIKTPYGKTSVINSNLKTPHQLEKGDLMGKPEDVRGDSSSAKKQKVISLKTDKASIKMKSPVTRAVKSPGIKKMPGTKVTPKKISRQLEKEDLKAESEDVKDDSSSAKKQVTSPKADKASKEIKSPATMATKTAENKRTPDTKVTPKKITRQIENDDFKGESEDDSLSIKKNLTSPKTNKADMKIKSPITIATKTSGIKMTSDMKVTPKKTLRQVESEDFKGKLLDNQDNCLSARKRKVTSPKTKKFGVIKSPVTIAMKSPGIRKSPNTKMTPKRISRQMENEDFKEDTEDIKDDSLSAKMQVTSPKADKASMEIKSPVTIATRSSGNKKTSDMKMTPKKFVNRGLKVKCDCVTAENMTSPKTSRADTEVNSPGSISEKSLCIKKTPVSHKPTPEKEKQRTPERRSTSGVFSSNMVAPVKTPATPKHMQSISTPTRRVTRSSSKACNAQPPTLGNKTPAKGGSTPAKARCGSTKKKTI